MNEGQASAPIMMRELSNEEVREMRRREKLEKSRESGFIYWRETLLLYALIAFSLYLAYLSAYYLHPIISFLVYVVFWGMVISITGKRRQQIFNKQYKQYKEEAEAAILTEEWADGYMSFEDWRKYQ